MGRQQLTNEVIELVKQASASFASTDPKFAEVTPETVAKWKVYTDRIREVVNNRNNDNLARQIALLALMDCVLFSTGIMRKNRPKQSEFDFIGAYFAEIQWDISEYMREYFDEAFSRL